MKGTDMDKTMQQLADLIYNSENCPVITKVDMLVDLKHIVDSYNRENNKGIKYD
jgi:hypothetical protein